MRTARGGGPPVDGPELLLSRLDVLEQSTRYFARMAQVLLERHGGLLLSAREAAVYAGTSVRSIHRWTREGLLTPIAEHPRRYDLGALDVLLAKTEGTPARGTDDDLIPLEDVARRYHLQPKVIEHLIRSRKSWAIDLGDGRFGFDPLEVERIAREEVLERRRRWRW